MTLINYPKRSLCAKIVSPELEVRVGTPKLTVGRDDPPLYFILPCNACQHHCNSIAEKREKRDVMQCVLDGGINDPSETEDG